ncbi:MAG: helix-turn-helix domain-containing protein [Spirosomaceae bacterium]|jgi:AraC-like DNA-binding protein|nr:helix-turn-helix domain-containing protein [Spirosomataceae bacterium]
MLLLLITGTMGAAFLLSFLLLLNPLRRNERANRWLGVFMGVVGASMLDIYLEQTQFEKNVPYFSEWLNTLRYVLAPSLYLAVSFFMHPTRRFERRDWWHFLPVLSFAIVRHIFVFTGRNVEDIAAFNINGHTFSQYFLPLQNLVYMVVSYQKLTRHSRNVELISADTDTINLDWLRNMILIFGVSVLFWGNEIFFEEPFLMRFTPYVYAISVFFAAYFSLKQAPVFNFQPQDLPEISAVIQQEKTKAKRLSQAQLHAHRLQLDHLMFNEKLYLENTLSLSDLAQKLDLSIHDTSYLINETTGDNFYNFINRHRIEEAKRLLRAGKAEDFNMLGIAFEAGFNSKTTFNTTFKKMVGMSPSAYWQSQRE